MQLMPATYAEIRRAHADFGDINEPEWNIAAAISYSADLWRYWIAQADAAFQRHFVLGSYNAGKATLMRAQKLAIAQKLNGRQWPSIEKIAAKVPNWRYQETLPYVKAVFVNLETMDRQGRTEGPTVSKQNPGGLEDQLKKLKKIGSVFKAGFDRFRR
jgi:soluble lytic murein transglycosylase-like protein